MRYDDNGQPVTERLRRAANKTRDIDELIGICRGIIFDDKVNKSEAEHLAQWLYAQPDLLDTWPASIIYDRLCEVLSDGVVDDREAADLLNLLSSITGSQKTPVESINEETGEVSVIKSSTALPVSEPESIEFEGRTFVLTGTFYSGKRSDCESEITSRGGRCTRSPNKATRYVVIGEQGSRDWIHSSWGRKIEKAIAMQDAGHEIEIISEQHWVKFLS
ncbi:BRCT domain-containing protein [Marinobacterium litorale]|uniref:BRCT domain-containing protein n=1 Tax=Marinobacterium litorale TaxID=404770 RepID=UPI0006883148|nr:BRCT domain-containing protein [Marinobacterium litorale]